MRRKIFIYSIFGLIMVVLLTFIVFKYYQHVQNGKIIAEVRNINSNGIEKQVIDKINKLLEQTIKNPGSDENWGKLGMNLYIHNFKEPAAIVFKKAASLNSEDFRWSYFCGITLSDLNDKEALEWFERSQKLNPDYPPLGIKLGNRYLMNGEFQKAKAQFLKIVQSGSKIPHAHLGLAKVAVQEEEFEEAKMQLHQALQMAPKYREAHAVLADVYRRTGDKIKAEEEFRLMEKLPNRLDLADPVYHEMEAEGVSSFWCQVRANNYLKAGLLDSAESELKKAVLFKPNAISYTSLGYVYQSKHQYSEAVQQYHIALQMDSNYVNAMNNLAVIYLETGETSVALELLNSALRINSESIDSYLNLGTCLKQIGRRGEAIENFRQGYRRAPDDMRFAYQLAWLLASSPEASLRNGKEAVHLAEIVCRESQFNNPVTLDLLAAALAENKQYREASETASRAYVLALMQKKTTLASEIETRQKLYKLNKAYRLK